MAQAKILFLCRSLSYGGAQAQLAELAIGLQQRQQNVLVVSFYGGHLADKLRRAGVPLIVMEKRGRWDVLACLGRLARLVRQEKPQVLHGYLPVPNLVVLLLKCFCPQAQVVWGIRASSKALARHGMLARLEYWGERLFMHRADCIIVNSHALGACYLQQAAPAHKLVVIPNGIDTECYRPDAAARARVRQEWGIGADELLIGMAGRLDPIKDYPTFLHAAALFARQKVNVRFACIGDGDAVYRTELQQLAGTLGLEGRLVWIGARQDMPAVYNALDVATLTSTSEGFPNVIAEAMACQVPCVATNVGEVATIIGPWGKVVPPGDPQKVAEGWQALLVADLARTGRQARQHIVSQFSLDRLFEQTEKVLGLQG